MKPAVAMIELVFAIVIMSIVMLSAPMLMKTASESGYVAIQQENIGEVASHVNIILGHYWDENNTDDSYDPVVLLTTGDAGLNEVGTTGLRAGTPNSSSRKYVSVAGERGTATPLASLGPDTGDRDDMDDFNGQINLRDVETSANADYIEKGTAIDLNTTVTYMLDAPFGGDQYNNAGGGTLSFAPTFAGNAGTSSNIKRIEVTLTSSSGITELEKQITLHAFSCNIGSYQLEERN